MARPSSKNHTLVTDHCSLAWPASSHRPNAGKSDFSACLKGYDDSCHSTSPSVKEQDVLLPWGGCQAGRVVHSTTLFRTPSPFVVEQEGYSDADKPSSPASTRGGYVVE